MGTSAGTYCGTTPFTFKYIKRKNYNLGGTLVSETIVNRCKSGFNTTYFYAFQCLVVKDGYRPYKAYKVLMNEKRTEWINPLNRFYTGSMTITAVLDPLQPQQPASIASPVPQPQQQQQQQQQQNIIIPDSKESFGKIILSCDVQDAEVYVDGVFVGNAPATLKLKDGIHIVEVKSDGYKDYRKELRVLGGSELSLRAKLTRK